MVCNILITNLTGASEINNVVTHKDTKADKIIILSNRHIEIYEIGQIPLEPVEIDESFEEFIKIMTPLFKENNECYVIIKPDAFGVHLLWAICEFEAIKFAKVYPEMIQLPLFKYRFFGARKKNQRD